MLTRVLARALAPGAGLRRRTRAGRRRSRRGGAARGPETALGRSARPTTSPARSPISPAPVRDRNDDRGRRRQAAAIRGESACVVRVRGNGDEHRPSRRASHARTRQARDLTRAEPTDGDLIERVGNGDRDAFEELYRRYTRPVLGLALRQLGDRGRAEDAFQDAFAAIWRSASSYDPERGQGGAWLYTVARNAIVDGARRRPEPPMEAPEEPSRERPRRARRSIVARLAGPRRLEHLPAHERPVIEARLLGRALAERGGRPARPSLGTVKTRTARSPASPTCSRRSPMSERLRRSRRRRGRPRRARPAPAGPRAACARSTGRRRPASLARPPAAEARSGRRPLGGGSCRPDRRGARARRVRRRLPRRRPRRSVDPEAVILMEDRRDARRHRPRSSCSRRTRRATGR